MRAAWPTWVAGRSWRPRFLGGQGGRHGGAKGLEAERLGQDHPVPPLGRRACRPIAGGEQERPAQVRQAAGHRVDPYARDIHVEDRQVEVRGIDHLQGLGHPGRRPDDAATQALNHVFEQHGHQGLVLDDQHAKPRQRVIHSAHSLGKAPGPGSPRGAPH